MVMVTNKTTSEIENVTSGGFCVGCGGCAAVDDNIEMKFTQIGTYEPNIQKQPNDKTDLVCPFSNYGPHENELGASKDVDGHKDKLGNYLKLYSGYVNNEDKRLQSSSGGGASWLISELFTHDIIDYVIHVKQNNSTDSILFEYAISSNNEESQDGAKTRYYPIEVSQVINKMRNQPGRYAFVGVPCYVKMIKRLANIDDIIKSRLIYTISIFCGHMKSAGFAESLSWQLGVTPDSIKTVNFRHKILDQPASDYGFEVINKDNKTKMAAMKNLYGKDWGLGAFRLQSCDFCDDIVGELADVSFGDAWLDEYNNDSKGHNLIIIRDKNLLEIFNNGSQNNKVHLEQVSPEQVVKSQDPSFRHRREGLKYRTDLLKKKNRWFPSKREFDLKTQPTTFNRIMWKYRSYYSLQTHKIFLDAKKKVTLKNYLMFSKVMILTNRILLKINRVVGKCLRVKRKILP